MSSASNHTSEPTTAKRFPLLPYSQLVWELMQTEPQIYNFAVTLRVSKATADPERLKKAITSAIRNHPVLSMAVDADGMQYYCPSDDILNGQFYSVRFQEDDNFFDVIIHHNRILGDNVSGRILTEDIFRAYRGLDLEPDPYLEYLEWHEQYKLSDRYEQQRQWLEQEFSVDCPVHPLTDLPLNIKTKAIEGVKIEDFTPLREQLIAISEKHIVSVSAIFSLAAAMAIMQYNNTCQAALTWAYEGRERPMEQRIFGSLHRDIPLLINADSSKDSLFRQIRTQMRQGIAHSSYPYTLTKPHTDRWNYAVNVMQMPANQDLLREAPFEAELIIPDTENLAYSLLDIEIYDKNQLVLLYRYSATHYLKPSIERYTQMVRRNIEWLIQ